MGTASGESITQVFRRAVNPPTTDAATRGRTEESDQENVGRFLGESTTTEDVRLGPLRFTEQIPRHKARVGSPKGPYEVLLL